MKTISISIVSWNTKNLTLACLERIATNTPDAMRDYLEVIVVDNDSDDGTAEAVKENHPEVVVIKSGGNIGFGRANNLAIKYASGDIVFFLNSDALITSNTLEVIGQAFSEDQQLGVLGCKLMEDDGTIQKSVRGHPNFTAILYSDTPLNLLWFLKPAYERYRQKNFDFSREQFVDTVMGAAMAVPKHILDKLGGFDPIYFMYYEEVDLCRRIGEAGYLVKYIPTTTVFHIGGASSSLARARMRIANKKSMFLYLRKHEGHAATALFSLLFKPLFVFQTMISFLSSGGKLSIACLFGRKRKVEKYKLQCRLKFQFLTRDLWSFIIS